MPTKIKSSNITADAVTASEIATGAVGTSEIADGTVVASDLAANSVTASEIAAGAVGASEIASTFDISSKTVTLPASAVTAAMVQAHASSFDDSDLQNDIALLGFKIATGDTAVKYSLADQIIDDFQSEVGIDTSNSANQAYNSSGKYYAVSASLQTYVAKGGGRGGPRGSGSGMDGGAGGSGGGSGTDSGGGHTGTGGTSNKNTYTGWLSYGSNGGTGQHVGGSHEGGGGGGGANSSGTNGGNFSGGTGGTGANGYQTSISGSSIYYAGGGGAGGNSSGSRGSGGGNTANRGGGGQGMAGGWGSGGESGGSGIVIFSYTPSGGSLTVSSITSTGTFTIPTGVSQADVLIVGGGGGGGSGNSAGGGGGGAILKNGTLAVTAGNTWDITIGNGGSANANGSDTTLELDVENTTMTLISNSNTAESAPTKGDLVFTYVNGAGTATYSGGSPTITAFISRNGSAYSSAVTLTKVGTTGTQTIIAAHDVDISGITSGTAMKYKIVTSGQSASMATRIHSVSLGWS